MLTKWAEYELEKHIDKQIADLYDLDEQAPDENPDDVFERLLLRAVQDAVKLTLKKWKRRPK